MHQPRVAVDRRLTLLFNAGHREQLGDLVFAELHAGEPHQLPAVRVRVRVLHVHLGQAAERQRQRHPRHVKVTCLLMGKGHLQYIYNIDDDDVL